MSTVRDQNGKISKRRKPVKIFRRSAVFSHIKKGNTNSRGGLNRKKALATLANELGISISQFYNPLAIFSPKEPLVCEKCD